MTETLDLFDYGASIQIEIPPAADVLQVDDRDKLSRLLEG